MEEEPLITTYKELYDGPVVILQGLFTQYLSEMLGPGHLLTEIAQQYENNLTQRDDVIVAMASRHGVYIPPVNYGDRRGAYTTPDGQYVHREYLRRLKSLAEQCKTRNIPAEVVRSWKAQTPNQVADIVRGMGIDVDPDEVDHEFPYYADRLALNAQLWE